MNQEKQKLIRFYDSEAENYKKMYLKEYKKYPANKIRFNIVLGELKKCKTKTVLDVGCGSGEPLIELIQNGFSVKGFDFSKKMVLQAKKELRQAKLNPNLVCWGNVEQKIPFKQKFDAIIALGVFPHIFNEKKALQNLGACLKPNGFVLIEFRNELFSLFTLNKYSKEFYKKLVNFDSLKNKKQMGKFYDSKLCSEEKRVKSKKLVYADVYAKFDNPLTLEKKLFEPNGFEIKNFLFYHYHFLPPVFEKQNLELFKIESLKLENSLDWRGYFMASAFVVKAKLEQKKVIK
jgi:SAM-dependent methyltransferase